MFLARTYTAVQVIGCDPQYRHRVLLSARETLRTLEGFPDCLRPLPLLSAGRARSLLGACGLGCLHSPALAGLWEGHEG